MKLYQITADNYNFLKTWKRYDIIYRFELDKDLAFMLDLTEIL